MVQTRAQTAAAAVATAYMSEQFLAQTQALAAEHVALQQQSQVLDHAQNVALMAMQASTQSSVRQLTDRQRAIIEELSEALTVTQSRLQDQLQHLQMLQDERGGQIERFMNDSLAHAQEEAQREAQIAASAHLEGVRQKLLEMEAKIDGGLENISQHVQQLVEDSLAASQLQRACGAVRQDLLTRVICAEEPLPESIRSLVLDITTNAERLVEGRVQKPLTNAQSELNLQVQRQANATTPLREQIRKLYVQVKRQAQKSDGATLQTTVADQVRQEVEERFRGVQINAQRESDANIKFRQEVQTQIRDYHSSINRSVQAAVGKKMQGYQRRSTRWDAGNRRTEKGRIKTKQIYGSDELNDGGDEDEPAADKDPARENRMQETRGRSYLSTTSIISLNSPVTNTTNVFCAMSDEKRYRCWWREAH
ncbi:hypothetical protein F443_13239 [Phytophthora nicotianae P1569]|uniref:Uncharacterized protein n=2 Tax=Phytophthora nicotianae TaxID=4792 RepID=V9EQM0_PHYNI|nr:hypothetical protein F443_13239 [Phytophthora nicotianae P1569]